MSLPTAHTHFLSTLPALQITTTSIVPAPIPNAGIGILATSPIPAQTKIAFVPRRSLLNLSTLRTFVPTLTIPATSTQRPSAHALLTLGILSSSSHPWISTFPTSFPTTPLLWTSEQQSLLPSSAHHLLSDQHFRFTTDLTAARNLGPVDSDAFITAWLAVNTRSLHFPVGGMTLCPFIDYFNHSPSSRACSVALTPRGYTVTTTTDITEGEEVFVTYGSHSGDFCLIEYGFVPEGNERDYVQVDAWMEFTVEQEERLQGMGYWGRYVLDREGFCYRAQTAARVVGKRGYLRGVLEMVREEIGERGGAVEMMEEGVVKEVLRTRWMQVKEIVDAGWREEW